MKPNSRNQIRGAGWRAGFLLALAVSCWQCHSGEGTSGQDSGRTDHEGHTTHPNNPEHAGHQAPTTHQDHAAHTGHTMASDSFDLSQVSDSPNRLVLSSQKTVTVAGTAEATPLTLTGYVAIDPRRSRTVATRVGGRIDKLYVRYTYQFVRKGDKLLELYSPELSTYQDEYKYLLRTGADGALLESSRNKLNLLGLSDQQIKQLATTDRPVLTVSVYSPYTGYVFWNDAPTASPSTMATPTGSKDAMAGGMASLPPASGTPSYARPGGQLKEGNYVNAGETLFTLNDLRTVWGILAVPPSQQDLMTVNQPLTLISELAPGTPIHTRIQYVEPVYQAGQKSVSVRTYLPNTNGRLKLNSLLTATLRPTLSGQHWIPTSSVYDLGTRKIVWVVKGQVTGGKKLFEARQVVTGRQAGNRIEIKKGLATSEEIALDAGYLTDSESLIALPQ